MTEILNKYYSVLCYDEEEEYEGIIDFLSEHISKHPRDSVAYHNRGLAKCEIGKSDEALKDYNRSIELSEKSYVQYFCRGELFKKQGNFELAEKDFHKGISIEPQNVYCYRNRAGFYADTGRLDLAIEDYSKAISLEPEFPYTYRLRGEAYLKLGNSMQYEKDIAAWKDAERVKKEKQEEKTELAQSFICPDTCAPFGNNSFIGEWEVKQTGESSGPILRSGKEYYKFKWNGTLYSRGF